MKSIAWLIAIAIAIAGCQGSGSDGEGAIARLNISGEPPSLDPRLAGDTTAAIVVGMLFDGLTRVDASGVPQPSVAEKIEISGDGLTYTFHLRDSHWWNGDAVTAEDFAYAWRTALDPSQTSTTAYKLYVIKGAEAANKGDIPLSEVGVTALDDKTLRVTLNNPTPYFLQLTAAMTFFPVNKKVAEANTSWAYEAADAYVGNGPFRLTAWRHHNVIAMTKNARYWDADAVGLDGINLTMVTDASTELAMFDEGNLDWAGTPLSMGLPPDAIPTLMAQGRLQQKAMSSIYFYQFNTTRVPFTNAKIRKAFTYAVDRAAIVDSILSGGALPAMGLLPPTVALRPTPYFADGDSAAAKRLFAEGLAELGMTVDTLPPITVSYNSGEAHHKIAQALQQQWREALGVTVALENMEWKVYLARFQTCDIDLGRMGWAADYDDPSTFLDVFRHADTGANCTGWVSDEYVALLDKALTTTDKKQRDALLLAAEGMIMEAAPLAPIYFQTNNFVKNPKLTGEVMSSPGVIDFKWASMTDPKSEAPLSMRP